MNLAAHYGPGLPAQRVRGVLLAPVPGAMVCGVTHTAKKIPFNFSRGNGVPQRESLGGVRYTTLRAQRTLPGNTF
jgi:hypothetical protein